MSKFMAVLGFALASAALVLSAVTPAVAAAPPVGTLVFAFHPL